MITSERGVTPFQFTSSRLRWRLQRLGERSAGDGVGEDGAFNGLFVLDLPDVCSKGDKVAGASRKVAEVGGVVEE